MHGSFSRSVNFEPLRCRTLHRPIMLHPSIPHVVTGISRQTLWMRYAFSVEIHYTVGPTYVYAVVKVVMWSRGAHLTKPGWRKPHTHNTPNYNLALLGHKITLYRFHQGVHTIAGGLKSEQAAEPPDPLTLTTACLLYWLFGPPSAS